MPEVEGQTVLVTGGGGFVGSHLVDALLDDNHVRVIDNFSTGQRQNLDDGAEIIQGDIRDPKALDQAMDGIDVVFHEAAIVSVDRSCDNPQESHAVNVDATVSLLERARQEDARVVFASSAAIYGQPTIVPIAEDAPKKPQSPYGLDKLTADHYCRIYNALYGVETVTLRYFNVYGPRQNGGDYSGVIEVFLRQCREDKPITVDGDGKQTRDFVHVTDVVRANLLAATTDQTGEAFNVGTGDRLSVQELAEEIRNATASNSKIVHHDPRPGDIDDSCADLSKARSELGFEPTIPFQKDISKLAY